MLTKDRRGELIAECDGCGQEFAGGTAEFQEFIRDLREAGWKAVREGNSWEHFCPECQREAE